MPELHRVRMIRFTAGLLLAATFLIVAGAQARAALRAVAFVSPTNGWVAGDGTIRATRDGGRTWQTQYSGRAQISSLYFVDGQVGWAAGIDAVAGTGVLLGTHDGGRTWTNLGEPRNPARTMSFRDARNGLAVAGGSPLSAGATERTPPFFGGRLARTSDGGHTWHVLDAPMLVDTTCWSNSPRPWAAYQAAVLRSEDGEVFSHVFSPHLETSRVWYASVRCSGDNVAWVQFASTAVGEQRPWIVFRTNDGGQNWQPLLLNKKTQDAYPSYTGPAGDVPGPWPGPFAVVDANTAFFVGACPKCGANGVTFTATTDGGATWQPVVAIPDIMPSNPLAVSFVDSTHGWIVGASASGRSIIATTVDGGRSWTRAYQK